MDTELKNAIRTDADFRFAKAKVDLILYFVLIAVASMISTGVCRFLLKLLPDAYGGLIGFVRFSLSCLVLLFVTGPMMVGFTKGILDLKTNDSAKDCIFYAFKEGRYLKVVRSLVLYTAVGFVPRIIDLISDVLGIRTLYGISLVTSLGVAFVELFLFTFVHQIIAEDIEVSPVDACLKSIKLMTGQQKGLWDLLISYIVVVIIVVVTCGIGLFYAGPLINCGITCFYERLKENDK